MAKVFLSYDRDDTERARPIALALEKAGHAVWWDLHIRGGEQFTKVIDEALKAADAVVVLWSKYSVESAWVRDEAAAGRDTGRLVPIALDDTDPPLGFRQFQTIDLSRWKGRGKPAELKTLLVDVEARSRPTDGGEAENKSASLAPRPVSGQSGRRHWPLAAICVAILVAIATIGWIFLRPTPGAPSVVVRPSEQSAASQALAHDLFVKLGSLQASNAEAVQLLDAQSRSEPTLIFQVGGNAEGAKPHANLILLNGSDRALLWSKEFTAPAQSAADLSQQLGFTAARIIGCATEGLNKKGRRLEQVTLKLYLNACAAFSETSGPDAEAVIPMLRQVTQQAPEFEGGWANLLLAETDGDLTTDSRARNQLEKDMAAARRVNPDMVELLVAEIAILPQNSFAKLIQLADRAVELGPNKPVGFGTRSQILLAIGRMNEAVEDARTAVDLDPLWPTARDFYISALLYAGRLDTAKQELAKAERLWPGATNLALERFRINFRYGDAKEALKVLGTGSTGWVGAESFLEARIDPSPAKVERALADSLAMYRRYREPGALAHVAQVWGEFGREKELIDLLLSAPLDDLIGGMEVMFRPALDDFWKDPKSLLIARRVGLLQYWRDSGKWPDFCLRNRHPYDCKKEAARLLA